MDTTLEDLLKLLEESDASPASSNSDVDESKIGDFLGLYNITAGVDRIPNYVVWYTYKKVYDGKLSKIEFFRQFKKAGFIQVRTGKQRSYMLDGRSFDLSREGKIEAEFFNKEKK